MVNDILQAVGIPYRRTRFLKPQAGDYIVWNDSIETDGGDGIVLYYQHHITIELYTAQPAPDTESRLEAALIAHGQQFERQEAYWLQSEQRYQTVYEFDYIEKRRN